MPETVTPASFAVVAAGLLFHLMPLSVQLVVVPQRADRQTGESLADEERQREVQRRRELALAGLCFQRVLQAAQGDHAQHDRQDRQLDVVGLPEAGPEEPGVAAPLAGSTARVLLLGMVAAWKI